MGGGGHHEVGSGSARGLALTVADGRGYPSPDTGSTCGGEVVTASGGGNKESSASGRESSGVGGIGKDATAVSLGTTTTEAATSTATRPTGLEWSGVFLMWEVGSCCDPVPKLGRVVSVYAAGMAGREDSGGGGGGFIMIPPRVPMDHRWTENGD